jgi:AcrR family transcriptional regulator
VTGRPQLLDREDRPPPPSQRRSREKRARLDAAALALFGEKGYEATSVEEIADRAGVAVGTLYQHVRSKRQLLLSLMDDLLERLARLKLQPAAGPHPRRVIHDLLAGAFATDLHYLGAYRAWQEAVLADDDLARKQREIHAWTRMRVLTVLQFLERLPGSRSEVDLEGLATVLDTFFWSLLGQAARMPDVELRRWIDAATHLMYHAMFTDPGE